MRRKEEEKSKEEVRDALLLGGERPCYFQKVPRQFPVFLIRMESVNMLVS
jgi:hypothetical protein